MVPNRQAILDLAAPDGSTRLAAAMALGIHPDPATADLLVARCAEESDFYVRDMLTWALTRLPVEVTVPRLVAELASPNAQARSQALHTLSKLRQPDTWPSITRALLLDADDEVARSAWRAAVVLVPEAEKPALARVLITQLGRGDRDLQLSLSRALVALGAEVVDALLEESRTHRDPRVVAHALATARLLADPDAGFELSMQQARRAFVLGGDRPS